MTLNHVKRQPGNFFGRIIRGLFGPSIPGDASGHPIDLRETRAVGIKIKGINKSFGDNHVLKDLDLEILPGETFSIIGPSGTGKSVLLKLIVRLDTPDSGQIYIDNVPLFGEDNRVGTRDYRYSMVFQSSALFNSLTVGENVGLWLRENRVCPERKIHDIIRDKLAVVGLEGSENLSTSELSGGMKKRVAIARSLAMNPDLILYDEPTAELDPVNSDELANTILKVRENTRNTTVIVTHDLNFALFLSDRIAMIHGGRIVQVGSPSEIRSSTNPIVRNFVYTTTKGIKTE
ncbi:MAG: ATP-binding cassette domain-containing protein [Geobacteraceae bacterium]|nr:ATP-binding cassette domain-containing protein [Geobacteraceae bacterium]